LGLALSWAAISESLTRETVLFHGFALENRVKKAHITVCRPNYFHCGEKNGLSWDWLGAHRLIYI
jgi:hypothetical protein